MTEAYLYDAIRTPRGRGKSNGALHATPAVDLLVALLQCLQQRHDLNTAEVDDVVLGCVTPIGEQGADIARLAVLCAGWDERVPGLQENRFCASGLEAVNLAAMKVRSDWQHLVVAGGVEAMSRVPMGADGGAIPSQPDPNHPLAYVPQGISADLIATVEGFTRSEVDAFALRSQQLATAARADGRFKSIVPVQTPAGLVNADEHIRPETTIEGLAKLKPAFQALGEAGYDAVALKKHPEVDHIEHVHTAGNASGIVDGAALVLVGSLEKGLALGLKPRARLVSMGLVGTEPTIMLTGPGPASRAALKAARMDAGDIDLFEVNEAFAAVVLRFMRDLQIDSLEQINVNGGAIALGHPLGATGAMLLGTALDELERRDQETALVTLCVGFGMGIATIIERV